MSRELAALAEAWGERAKKAGICDEFHCCEDLQDIVEEAVAALRATAARSDVGDWQAPEWTEIIHLVSDGMTLNCDTRPDCGGYTDHGNAAHNMVRSALGERLPWLPLTKPPARARGSR